jgi:hypothetical protein
VYSEHSTVASIHINTRVPYLAYYIMFPRGRGGKSVKKGERRGEGGRDSSLECKKNYAVREKASTEYYSAFCP